MRLLDRYLLRELLVPLAYCLAGFQIFWTAFDLYSNLDEYRQAKLSFAQIGELYLCKTPELLTTVLPMGLLLGVKYALTQLARNNEITAMRAAGIGLTRLSLPFVGTAVVLGVGQFALIELVGADAAAAAERLQRGGAPVARGVWHERMLAINDVDGRRHTLGPVRFNESTRDIGEVTAEFLDEQGGRHQFLPQTGKECRGEWTSRGWLFYNVQWLWFAPGAADATLPTSSLELGATNVAALKIHPRALQQQVALHRIETRLGGSDLSKEAGRHLLFSVGDLLAYCRQKEGLQPGQPMYARVYTQLHGRLAQAWTCLAVVLVALPLGTLLGKRKAFVGVASSIAICFAYMLFFQGCLTWGTNGALPALGMWGPVVAAWLPNVVVAGTGLFLSRRLQG